MDFFNNACVDRKYPSGDFLAERALNIPIHDSLTINQAGLISKLIIEFFEKN